MNEKPWRVGQFNDGSWTSGGSKEDYPDDCFQFVTVVMASSHEQAVRKGQYRKRKETTT